MRPYLTQALHRAVQQRPEREAVIAGATRLDCATLTDRVAQLAAGLRSLGMREDARVAVLALGWHRYIETHFGVWWGGGVVDPINVRWSARALLHADRRLQVSAQRGAAHGAAALRGR